ncbi:flotillin family protein [Actinomarinicola tropica]|uniref:Flotillin family protein n=1 Tax=Actinomarinicola tropica TaxID=2789776 RepID=A0A5Q2RQZ5_9ACTN|nr:flotillin family protein [Actinomarinicola tropica]QGG96856.1 flotillin family protein [Actinomarinicola tropica]
MNTVLIAVAAAVGLLVLVIAFLLSRIKVAGPNEAFIITGRKGQPVKNPETGEVTTDLSGQKVVMGASVFVVPFVQRLESLDLSSRQILVQVGSAVSSNGIRCSLEGVAIVKVGGTEDAIRAAGQRFLGQQTEVDRFTTEVLAGSLRSIVGRLTIEEIIRDRAAFAREVSEEAEVSLTNQGLVLDTFQLQDIQAEGNYIQDLGRPEAARAEKEAKIAEAVAQRESEQARLQAEEEVAEAQRQLALRVAQIKAETDAAEAEAAAAGPKSKAAQDREVLAAQQEVAEEQATLKERELDTEVRKPADAARYAVEQEAEGRKVAAIRDAEARRESTIAAATAKAEEDRLIGAGERQRREELAKAREIEGRAEGEAEKARREALAEAVRVEGEAEAAAILARGEAEATAMEKKADAFEQYGDAAIVDLLASALPEVVGRAAEPLSAIDKMTVISTDGASQITRNVSTNVAQGLQLASDLTGVDLTALFTQLATRRANGGSDSPPASVGASSSTASDSGDGASAS